MPHATNRDDFANAIDTLKTGWANSWFRWFFYPSAMGQVLRNWEKIEAEKRSFELVQAWISGNWLVRWWFRSHIVEKTQQSAFDEMIDAAITLQQQKIFSQDTFDLIKSHAITDLSVIGDFNRTVDRLATSNPNLFGHLRNRNEKPYDNLHDIVNELTNMNLRGILTPDNRHALKNHQNPRDLAHLLCLLKDANFPIQNNLEVLKYHPRPDLIISGIKQLQLITWASMLTVENIDALINIDQINAYETANALIDLEQSNLLTQDNREYIKHHPNPSFAADFLIFLNPPSDNTRKVMAKALLQDILTDENIPLIKNQTCPKYVVISLQQLKKANILNQERFNELVDPRHSALLSQTAIENFWKRMPHDLLTEDNWTQILAYVRGERHQEDLNQDIRDLHIETFMRINKPAKNTEIKAPRVGFFDNAENQPSETPSHSQHKPSPGTSS